ncbi:MAG TPA: NAD-dependent DNA ligase LigA [Polyangiaceae bacterium]|jgi:DNA ligase (NAD+)|nr:NAD-dependent DNA ligase LigA [Polyangiaceae bacterium]
MSAIPLHDLRNRILKARQAYYYGGQSKLSDAEYDALEDELRERSPEDPILTQVGAPLPADRILTKATHRIPMGSQNKVNSESEFLAWYTKSAGSGAVQASIKGDGASAAAYYEAGRLVQAISRGDGVIGEDISANAAKFKGLPVWVEDAHGNRFTGAVRFEVILTVNDWKIVDPTQAKNPRNAGSGIMGRKNGEQAELLSCYAFSLDEQRDGGPFSFETETQIMQRLQELGFTCIPHKACATPQEGIEYFRSVEQERDALDFWIDGVVFKVDSLARQRELGVLGGRPRGQVAWKFDSKGAETKLVSYSLSVGHTGAVIPTAELEPVQIGGTTVSNALLNNWDEIARLDVAVGDTVWLIKANDIIPKITHVRERPAERKPIAEPHECPVCHGPVGRRKNTGGQHGAIIECQNDECPAKSVGKLKRWIKNLDIQGIGDVVRHALVEQMQVEDAGGLYRLKDAPAALAELVINPEKDLRLGQKRAQGILEQIEARRRLTLIEFLGSLGIDRLASRRVELMMRAAGGELDRLEDWRSGKLNDPAFAERVGVPSVGVMMQASIDLQSDVIEHLLEAGVEITGTGLDALEAQPAGQTLCITGKLPSGKKKADYEEPLARIGIRLVDDVKDGLDFLVLADPASTSTKAEKARKLGVQLLSEAELALMIEG